ncbi:DUF1153 domain-containing protein [Pseudaeromonas sharmana]|uniref:DUF1153 domain-containing protein n=1 Tax=Pseudaeromonas sharmana TaxID=328412 RepID=A0ABV8CLQ9_9GAMM
MSGDHRHEHYDGDEEIKRWTAKRKTALVMDIIQGKTTVSEAARGFDLAPSEIEEWVNDAKQGMENALRAKPLDIREQYEKASRGLWRSHAGVTCQKKVGLPARRGRQIVADVQQGLRAEGTEVSVSKICRWFGLPRRSWYYRSVKAAPKVQEHLVTPIKAMIEENPSFGYRTVAALLGFNKNTVQRIFALKGWQVRKRPVGFRLRIQCLPSAASAPNRRWATGLCRFWAGRDGWCSLALVIGCHTRELLGWHLSRSGKSKTLEQALITRFGCLGRITTPFLLQMGWCLPVATRPRSLKAMGYKMSSSRRTRQSKAAWLSG